MTIGSFITVTDPYDRGDTYDQCLDSAEGFSDVVTVINGKETWPKEFSWEIIGQHFQKGYEDTDADWVIHLDTDFIFHERDYGRVRQALKDYPNSPAVSFYKWQFILPDRYNLKSRLVLAVNKAKFGDRIKFNGSGDLCQPTLDGKDMDLNEIPQAGVPFFNYEKLIKTEAQVRDDVERMDRAYHRHFGRWLYSQDGEGAYEGWMHMAVGRFGKPQKEIALHDHPKVMQDAIKNLRHDQFGHSGFGYLPKNNYVT